MVSTELELFIRGIDILVKNEPHISYLIYVFFKYIHLCEKQIVKLGILKMLQKLIKAYSVLEYSYDMVFEY